MSNYDPEKVVKAIRRGTRRKYSAEEKIRIDRGTTCVTIERCEMSS